MQQERIVETFETEGGIRSHQEVFVHNTLLKATRNIFRFYSRKLTDSFYRWKYTIQNVDMIDYQNTLERKQKQLKKAVEDKQKKLYNTRKELESTQNHAQILQNKLLKQNLELRIGGALKSLENVFRKPKVRIMFQLKMHMYSERQSQSFTNHLKQKTLRQKMRASLLLCIKTCKKSYDMKKRSYFQLWKEYAFEDYDFSIKSFYQSQLNSTAPYEISLVKVKDSASTQVQKQLEKEKKFQRKQEQLAKVKGLCYDMLRDAIHRNNKK